VVVSAFEHPSVLEGARKLRERGMEVSEVAPGRDGVVRLEDFVAAVQPDTAVVALMAVQNELGTIQPVDRLAKAVRAKAPRAHVHVDAVQAFGKLPIDVVAWDVDSLSVSAHKIHGPKGCGALWLRRNARIASFVFGGGQERGVRPGTENVPGIVGFGIAAEQARAALADARRELLVLQQWFVEAARSHAPRMRVNGEPGSTVPHIVSIGFPGVAAEPLLHALEARGVYVSAGSACHSKDKKPSATLRAIGVPDDTGVIRVSFSRYTTQQEIAFAAEALGAALRELA
jgi:cysteine desulfurase